MIKNLNMDHTDFDMASEVLCTIPRHPQTAKSKDLLEDFGVPTWEKMTQYITSLRKSGHKIHIEHQSKNQKGVYLDRDGWIRARTAGEIYWNKLYGH